MPFSACRFGRILRGFLRIGLLAVLASCSKTTVAGVLLKFETDGTLDPDTLHVTITANGRTPLDWCYPITNPSTFFPTTLAIAPNGDPTETVSVTASVLRAGVTLDVRENYITEVPNDRVLELDIIFSANCSAQVSSVVGPPHGTNCPYGEPASLCPSGETCSSATGLCVSNVIPPGALPDAGTPFPDGGSTEARDADATVEETKAPAIDASVPDSLFEAVADDATLDTVTPEAEASSTSEACTDRYTLDVSVPEDPVCENNVCPVANTLTTCLGTPGCADPVCSPGFANCDRTAPDCELSYDPSQLGCFPTYLGTEVIATNEFPPYARGALAPDGTIFLAGEFQGTVDFDPTGGQDVRHATSALDFFVTELHADGSYGWTRTFGSTMSVSAIAPSSGSVVLAGAYTGQVDSDMGTVIPVAADGLQHPFVLKLDASGVVAWAHPFAPVGGGGPVAVRQDGTIAAIISDNSFSGSASLAAVSSSGQELWEHDWGGPSCSDLGVDGVTFSADGNVWMAGSFQNECMFDTTELVSTGKGPSQTGMFIASYTPTGTARGVWSFSGDGGVIAESIVGGTDGSVYVSGEVYTGVYSCVKEVDFDPGVAAVTPFSGLRGGDFVLKLGPDGAFQWVQTWVGDVNIDGLAPASDGGVLATGEAIVTTPVAKVEFFVSKMNADGSPSWTLPVGGEDQRSGSISVGSTASGLVVMGVGSDFTMTDSYDFDPGPGVALVTGEDAFVTRYAF